MKPRHTHETHPARRAEVRDRRLPGPQKLGVGAAEIGTAQGTDGLWYARHAAHFGSSGYAAPITHSEPFETEDKAVAWAAHRIKRRALALLIGSSEAESSRRWARAVVDWCDAQLGPQQIELAL